MTAQASRQWVGASAAHRKYRASLARGNTLFLQAIRRKERDTDFCRAGLGCPPALFFGFVFLLALGKSLTAGVGMAQAPHRSGDNLPTLLDRPGHMGLAGNKELDKVQDFRLLLRRQNLTELDNLFEHVH